MSKRMGEGGRQSSNPARKSLKERNSDGVDDLVVELIAAYLITEVTDSNEVHVASFFGIVAQTYWVLVSCVKI